MTDADFMRRALELAEQGRYGVSPNPMVGCVIVREGTIIAEGWHRRAGGDHAEVDALSRCAGARGATMYVTLEPCSHHGRTPPCADAVVSSGVSRVVVAMLDPDDRVKGSGIAHLQANGIDVTTGVCEPEAWRLNEKFIWSATYKLPFVALKAGMTLDGKLATASRESQWITSADAREKGLALREEFDAILVGSGTVKADNPRLTRRLRLSDTPWTRVVLDGDGEVPPHSQLLTDGGRTLLFTSAPPLDVRPGVEVVHAGSRLDLRLVLAELHARGIHSLLVEGGALIHSEMIARSLWQKMIVFVAPMVVGGQDAPSLFAGPAVATLTDAHRFRFDRVEFAGGDLMIVAYPA